MSCVGRACPSVSSLSLRADRRHGALRSFPTRRSSDLGARCVLGQQTGGGMGASPSVARFCLFHARTTSAVRTARSEEHTSELQSRRDLVCRLLLEKKKSNLQCAPRRHTPTMDTCCYAH